MSLVAFLLVGLMAFACCLKSGERYWEVVLLLMIFSGGVYSLRFPIFDEWVAIFSLLAAGAVFLYRKNFTLNSSITLRHVIFIALIVHLLAMSVFGYIAYDNMKALRFSVIYLTILALSLMVFLNGGWKTNFRQFSKNLLWMGAFYYTVVLVHWLVAKSYGLQPHILEGIGFAGTSYLALINIVVVPVAFKAALSSPSLKGKYLPGLVLVLSVVISILSDSRAAILPIFLTVFVFFLIKPLKAIKYALSFALVGTFFSFVLYGHNHWVLDIVDSFVSALNVEQGKMTFKYYDRTVTAAKGDAGRFMYVSAASRALVDNPQYLLTGVGNYGYFPVAGEYYYQLGMEKGISTNVINYGSTIGGISEPPRPPAMGAFVVEAGLMGVCLFLLSVILTGVHICLKFERGKLLLRRQQLLLTVPLLLLLIWPYFGEIQDVIFLYFLIMPGGILDILAEDEAVI